MRERIVYEDLRGFSHGNREACERADIKISLEDSRRREMWPLYQNQFKYQVPKREVKLPERKFPWENY